MMEEEDTQHEFKGHRTVCRDEMSPHFTKLTAKGIHRVSTRQPWTRTICGFLNSQGGTLYSGVLDDGSITGILLSSYQKLHIQLAVEDALDRFQPPVSKEMYKVSFVPVIEHGEQFDQRDSEATKIYPNLWNLRHKLRTYRNCWCDNDSMASVALGIIPDYYVVEVEVKGSKEETIYLAEDEICYMRKNARNERYSVVEIRDLQQERRKQQTEVTKSNPNGTATTLTEMKEEVLNHTNNNIDIVVSNDEVEEWLKDNAEFQSRKHAFYQNLKAGLNKQAKEFNMNFSFGD